MSETESAEQEVGALAKVYWTVSPSYASRPDAEMDSIGWAMFLMMLALFVPLLPLVVVVWLVSKGSEAVVGRD
jgi:hypothetical protein